MIDDDVDDDWWLMIGDWWLMIDDWWLMIDDWWLLYTIIILLLLLLIVISWLNRKHWSFATENFVPNKATAKAR